MRLSSSEVSSIKKVFKNIFDNGEIYVFGSRVDDRQKGGDIDLFIVSDNSKNILDKKLDFLVALKDKIGEQKIDLVISKDKTRLIEQEAMQNGIRL